MVRPSNIANNTAPANPWREIPLTAGNSAGHKIQILTIDQQASRQKYPNGQAETPIIPRFREADPPEAPVFKEKSKNISGNRCNQRFYFIRLC